jgi:hypothetical protein
MSDNTLRLIEQEIQLHHSILERLMIARAVILDVQKRKGRSAPAEEMPKRLTGPASKGKGLGNKFRAQALRLIAEHGPLSTGELRAHMTVDKDRAQNLYGALNILLKEGKLVRLDDGRHAIPQPADEQVAA